MKTILKITAGVLLAGTIAIVGFAALLGGAANSVASDQEKDAATPAQVARIKHGMKQSEVQKIMAPAKGQLETESSTAGLGESAMETYDVKDGGKLLGKSVTVFYSDHRVADITQTDLGA
jgi:hypothetical protein